MIGEKAVLQSGRKILFRLGALGGVILVLALILSLFVGHGGGGGGNAAGNTSSQGAQAPSAGSPAQSTPMEVVIQGDRYLVAGKEMTIEQIVAAARSAGNGAIAKILSGPDSRVGAQRQLTDAMDAARVSYLLESPSPR